MMPDSASTARIRAIVAAWASGVPWLKFRRNAETPASSSRRSASGRSQAGPTVVAEKSDRLRTEELGRRGALGPQPLVLPPPPQPPRLDRPERGEVGQRVLPAARPGHRGKLVEEFEHPPQRGIVDVRRPHQAGPVARVCRMRHDRLPRRGQLATAVDREGDEDRRQERAHVGIGLRDLARDRIRVDRVAESGQVTLVQLAPHGKPPQLELGGAEAVGRLDAVAGRELPERLPLARQRELDEPPGQLGVGRPAQHPDRIGIDDRLARRIDIADPRHLALAARRPLGVRHRLGL
jgi:hypothetical protein